MGGDHSFVNFNYYHEMSRIVSTQFRKFLNVENAKFDYLIKARFEVNVIVDFWSCQ